MLGITVNYFASIKVIILLAQKSLFGKLFCEHINNVPDQLLKKDSTTKIKVRTLKQLKALRDNEITDNK